MKSKNDDASKFLSSPEYVRTSLAASISLGMECGQFARGGGCTCLNILLNYEEGCFANCAYCGLAGDRKHSGQASFIRVKWPVYSLQSILDKLLEKHPFKRICVSMVNHPRAMDDSLGIIDTLVSKIGLPVSVLLSPAVMNGVFDMRRIKDAGADMVGVAIDAATEELFDSTRGKGVGSQLRWDRFVQAVDEAVSVFGKYKAGVHLIVGLGESEREMARIIEDFFNKGALTHLFSFYPEKGSLLENHPRPSIGKYRRIQLARYLINESICKCSDFTFSTRDEILDFGVDIRPFIDRGVPFMTSGCLGQGGFTACNRPFSNERPSEAIRNYYFVPTDEDKEIIAAQIFEDITTNA